MFEGWFEVRRSSRLSGCLPILSAVFLTGFVIFRPRQAAEVAKSVGGGILDAGVSIGGFLVWLFS